MNVEKSFRVGSSEKEYTSHGTESVGRHLASVRAVPAVTAGTPPVGGRWRRELADFMEQQSDALIAFDSAWRVLHVSEGASRELGRSLDSLRGKRVCDEFPEALRTPYATRLRRVMETRVAEEFEELYVPHGRWYRTCAVPTEDGGLVAVFQDVTERKRLEAALQENRDRLEFALESSGDGLWDWHVPSGYMYLSRRGLAMLGYREGDLDPDVRACTSLCHPDDIPHLKRRLQEHLNGLRHRFECEFRLRHQEGYYVWVSLRARAVSRDNASGDPLRVVGTIADIHRRKEAEQALAASEARFRQIADSLPQLVWMSVDGAVNFHNRRWYEYTGQTQEQAVGSGWRNSIHPEDLTDLLFAQETAFTNGHPYELELRLRRHDGVWRWHLSCAMPVREAEDGRVVSWVGTLTDITERKEVEARQAAEVRRQEAIAETLQRSLLIMPDPLDFGGMDIHARYEAAATADEILVGGDFHDVFPLEVGGAEAGAGEKIALVVGDVTGKGLAAAAWTAEVKFTLRALVREYVNPVTALRRLNRHLWQSGRASAETGDFRFVCVTLAVLDTASGETEIAVAGMEPPLIARAQSGEVDLLEDGDMPLGVLPDWGEKVVAGQNCLLEPGDALLLYSDGFTEAHRGSVFFGQEGLLEAVRSAAPVCASSPEHLADQLVGAVMEFTQGHPQDDLCLLVAQRALVPVGEITDALTAPPAL